MNINLFRDHITIDTLCKRNLPTKFRLNGARNMYTVSSKNKVIEFINFIDFKSICYTKISAEDIEKYLHYAWRWAEIFSSSKINEEFLERHSHRPEFYNCISNIRLSEDFLEKYYSILMPNSCTSLQNISEELYYKLIANNGGNNIRCNNQFFSKEFLEQNKFASSYKNTPDNEYSKWIA